MCDAIAPFPINVIQEMREHTLLLLRKQLIACRRVLFSLNKIYFTASTISPCFNTPPLYKVKIINKIIACSEIPFSKKLNQLTGFYMIRVFTNSVSEQTIANLFPNYYTQCKRNTPESCYTKRFT